MCTLISRRIGFIFARFKNFVETTSRWNISKYTDATGREVVPLELKVSGALRRLSTKALVITKQTHIRCVIRRNSLHVYLDNAQIFHDLMDHFVEEFKDDAIFYPKTAEEASNKLEHFK